jgi:hypothetical protein
LGGGSKVRILAHLGVFEGIRNGGENINSGIDCQWSREYDPTQPNQRTTTMADMYFQLIVIAVDGTEIVLKDVWKDLTVERFKKQISRQLGAYQTPPEDMLLQSMGMKLDDGSSPLLRLI